MRGYHQRMCVPGLGVAGASLSAPRAVTGSATDPIRLEPVDELRVTTLVDNVFDALLVGE